MANCVSAGTARRTACWSDKAPGLRSRVSTATLRQQGQALAPRPRMGTPRRRLPMVEFDGTVEVVGARGPVPFLDHDRDDGKGPYH
ncbi:hypothetical protein GCM10022221_23530 [Actinocorallia aurea]